MGTSRNMCICQICTCGRHHCAHRPQSNSRPSGPCVVTEYKDTYKKFDNYEPIRPIIPDSTRQAGNKPFDATTTYSNVFVPHDSVPIPKREPDKYIRPDGQFEGTSSYQKDFFPKARQAVQSAKPQYNRPENKPFDSSTVHKETYQPWELPSHSYKVPKSAIRLPDARFEHKTTFQKDYQGHKGHTGRTQINPPEPTLTVGAGQMGEETTTRADYTKKDAKPEKSAKPPHVISTRDVPFTSDTTVQNDYQWRDGLPAESCRPVQTSSRSNQPLDAATTHNSTYKAWQVPRRTAWKPDSGWQAPKDSFDHKTTFQQDYMEKAVMPAKSARPDYNRPKPGDFDSMTTHKNEFKQWDTAPRRSYRPHTGMPGKKSKFDGKTTFQSDFKGFQNARPDLCIPKEGGVSLNVGDQDFGTSYADTFLGERPPSCPAKYLELRPNMRSQHGFTYQQDLNGHQYFQPPSGIPDHMRETVRAL